MNPLCVSAVGDFICLYQSFTLLHPGKDLINQHLFEFSIEYYYNNNKNKTIRKTNSDRDNIAIMNINIKTINLQQQTELYYIRSYIIQKIKSVDTVII